MALMRCCVFAHFDQQDIVDPYVLGYLDALIPLVDKLVFVSTSQLNQSDLERLFQRGIDVICRENFGYDFYSWKVGLDALNLDDYDEFLQVNDSCYAPLFDLDAIFETMEKSDCDFWCMTQSYFYNRHAQSYFVCYKSAALNNPAFRQFWKDLAPIEDKKQLIVAYEVGISRILIRERLKMESYFKVSLGSYLRVLPRNLKLKISVTRNFNPYKYLRAMLLSNPPFHFYQEMLAQKVPLIKISLIKGIPFSTPPTNLLSVDGINFATIRLIYNHQKRIGSSCYAELWIPPDKIDE